MHRRLGVPLRGAPCRESCQRCDEGTHSCVAIPDCTPDPVCDPATDPPRLEVGTPTLDLGNVGVGQSAEGVLPVRAAGCGIVRYTALASCERFSVQPEEAAFEPPIDTLLAVHFTPGATGAAQCTIRLVVPGSAEVSVDVTANASEASPTCTGDCDGDGVVRDAEISRGYLSFLHRRICHRAVLSMPMETGACGLTSWWGRSEARRSAGEAEARRPDWARRLRVLWFHKRGPRVRGAFGAQHPLTRNRQHPPMVQRALFAGAPVTRAGAAKGMRACVAWCALSTCRPGASQSWACWSGAM